MSLFGRSLVQLLLAALSLYPFGVLDRLGLDSDFLSFWSPNLGSGLLPPGASGLDSAPLGPPGGPPQMAINDFHNLQLLAFWAE